MSTHAETIVAKEVAIAAREGARSERRTGDPSVRSPIPVSSRARADRQLRVLVAVASLVLILPATIGWLTRWRWKPWPAGRGGYGSIFHEAHVAAAAYVPIGFGGL